MRAEGLRRVPLAAAIGLALSFGGVRAAEYDIVIGGGWEPNASQVQIEHNIDRVGRFLDRRPGPRRSAVFFTNGSAPEADVKLNLPPGQGPQGVEQVRRRVLGDVGYGVAVLRKNRLDGLAGGTRLERLLPALERLLRDAGSGDGVFLYYNGHGLPDPQRDAHPLGLIDPARNNLRLWDDSRLEVRQLADLLDHMDPDVPVRFVFTQCYSGGFLQLIHPAADPGAGLAQQPRCGFVAVSAWSEAEGCTASIESDDYRDYTRYLLQALDGPAAGVDRDGNDAVDLYEAHLHALRRADSRDLPRSTSEYYLERQQPWYRRWFGSRQPDNRYTRLAAELAAERGLTQTDGRLAGERLYALREQLDGERERLRRELKAVQGRIAGYQAKLRPLLLQQAAGESALLAAIAGQPAYRGLVADQDALARLEGELLTVERRAAQLDKIVRLRRLGRALADLYAYGAAEQVAGYERLLACERRPL